MTNTLNQHQQQCVTAQGHLLIIACPGSGKTTVLTHRSKHLMTNTGNDKTLLAVTFSKDAAKELKERIANNCPEAKSRIAAGTFHSLSKTLLERAYSGNKRFRINLLRENEIFSIIKDVIDTHVFPWMGKNQQPKASFIKQQIDIVQSCLNPLGHPIMKTFPEVKVIFEEYEDFKAKTGRMDFADLMIKAVQGMRNGEIQPFRADYILGDEAQDMDEIQHAWIQCHADNGTEITLVADDDQSIFSFRQATGYKGLQKFARELRAEQKILPVNYRCGSNILTCAEKLINNNNPDRVDKPIKAGSHIKGEIHAFEPFPAFHPKNGTSEELIFTTNAIADSTYAHYEESPGTVCEWGVLARTNVLLNKIEEYLLAEAIPYIRKKGSIWDLDIARQYLAILSYISTGEWFGMSLFIKPYHDSDNLFQPHIRSLLQLYKADLDSGMTKGELKNLNRFIYLENHWKAMLNQGDSGIEDCLNDVFDFLINAIRKNPSISDKAKDFYFDILMRCKKRLAFYKNMPLDRRITKETLVTGLNDKVVKESIKEAIRNRKPFVWLYTLHGSKGLEFDNVAMIGCGNGVLLKPKSDGTTPNVQEERRLFYVGMTRAKKRLMCTFSHIYVDPQTYAKDCSSFLNEAGIDLEPIC